MKQLRILMTLGTVAATLALTPPVWAKSHVPLWDHGFEVVSTVTPSTVVIKHQAGLEQKLSIGQISVQAAIYPATAGILRPGEHVTVFQEPASPPLVVVHPQAYGTLTKAGTLWTVTSKHRGAVTLVGSNPVLLGMRDWQAGEKVMVFGPSAGDNKVSTAALAAVPLVARSTLQTVSADSLTLKSDQYGLLTYSLKQLPARWRQHFNAMSPGQTVIANLNPLNRQVLMVWPDHLDRWAKTLERGSAGQIVAVSSTDVTLTNHLGTVTIPINKETKVQWPGHKDATTAQLSAGTRILAVRQQNGQLRIMVLAK